MKRIFIIIGVFAVLIITLVAYLSTRKSTASGSLELSGTVEGTEIDLAFKAGGRIDLINFDEGDDVTRGDTIAEFTHREIKAQIQLAGDRIAVARARLKSLQIEKETAERNLRKVVNLLPAGGATENQKEDLEDKIRGLDAGIDAASNELKSAISQKELLMVNLDNEYLISPITGDVLLRSSQPGEIANPGQTVMTLLDRARLKIKVYIPEIYLGRIKVGQDVKIMIDSYPDKVFPGEITAISDKAEFTPKNIQTRDERIKTVYAVTVSSDDQGGILKPGMPCDVRMDLEPSHD